MKKTAKIAFEILRSLIIRVFGAMALAGLTWAFFFITFKSCFHALHLDKLYNYSAMMKEPFVIAVIVTAFLFGFLCADTERKNSKKVLI